MKEDEQRRAEEANTAELLRCGHCQTPHARDARFCSRCGSPVVHSSSTTLPGAATSSSAPASGDAISVDEADPLVGRTLANRYRIISVVGRGGMGVVYKIEHVHIGKLMAMKLLAGDLARDRDTLKRFKREAEAASRLSHANTVQIFDFGRDEGLTYLVMEYLEGADLSGVIQAEGALPFPRVARLVTQVCSSVAEAHQHGIIHRDLKPENIMVLRGKDGAEVVKVLDFGLAKLRHDDAGLSLTRAGSILGTPYYMAPEAIRGDPTDHRVDIYAVGALMYKAITGVPPFWAETPMGVLTKHITEEVVPPSQRVRGRDIPADADAIVLRAMEKRPDARYQRMEELRDDLVGYLQSIGDAVSDSQLRPATGRHSTARSARRSPALATRGDIDAYERRIRLRGLAQRITLGAVLVAVAGAAGYYAWDRRETLAPRDVEVEPNGTINEAQPLAAGQAVSGYLGRRTSFSESDRDVYALRVEGTGRFMRLEVSAIPNMNIAVDVVRSGYETPVLVANSGWRGEPEIIPSLPLRGDMYWLRVREHGESGVYPTENVSDPYTIRWEYVTPGPNDEHEINDSLEIANEIELGASRSGFIGWAGDVDAYCVREAIASGVVRVDPPPELDVVLRVVDRPRNATRAVDQRAAGGHELVDGISVREGGALCLEIAADASQGGRVFDAVRPYLLRVEAARGAPR